MVQLFINGVRLNLDELIVTEVEKEALNFLKSNEFIDENCVDLVEAAGRLFAKESLVHFINRLLTQGVYEAEVDIEFLYGSFLRFRYKRDYRVYCYEPNENECFNFLLKHKWTVSKFYNALIEEFLEDFKIEQKMGDSNLGFYRWENITMVFYNQ